ncbi:MAG TPA: hypothetical protein VK849_14085 [Longimicrobiales bacterium]|nr:hypothetical protein [Longimicrobiales bacterium]
MLALAYFPLHRLLRPERTSLAGEATRALVEPLWRTGLWGTLLVAAAAAALASLVRADPLDALRPLGSRLARVPGAAWAALLAASGLGLAAWAATALFARTPLSVDAMVQLAHARALLAARLSLPLHGAPAAWLVQNSVVVDGGLASVYPPGHTAALAAGMALGAAWLVGPVSVAVTGACTFLVLARLAPEAPVATRVAGALAALSPFVLLLGAGHLSHGVAGALAALLALTVIRARDGAAPWSLAAGAALGAMVCSRPWTGLSLGSAMVCAGWLAGPDEGRRAPRWLGRRVGGLLLGGAPFAAAFLAWNRSLFDGALRLGYSVAFGPAHGLGLHADPWGNRYGPVEALAYTGADLVQLGAGLLESPLPAVAVVGAALVALPPRRGRALLWTWALVPPVANALYWHHGTHLGPRMLYESAPAWAALWAMAIAEGAGPASPLSATLRRGVAWVGVLSLAGALALLPGRLASSRIPVDVVLSARLPGGLPGPTLVFAHGSWSTRIAGRLAATGMRRDSIETALRRNATCAVDAYARWRAGPRETGPPALDLEPRPGTPDRLRARVISPGNRILVEEGGPFDEACTREAMADRLGTVELEPLLWQAPPLPGRALVVVRDLGPRPNASVRTLFPGYGSAVLLDGGQGEPPRLVPYDEGMELVWRGAASVDPARE